MKLRHFGMLVPCTNTTAEIELGRLPLPLQAHTGRLGKRDDSPFTPGLDADVSYQSKMLAAARVEVIAIVQTSASLFSDDYDDVACKLMTGASGVPSLTSAQAIGGALNAWGIRKVAMATPYSPDAIARASRYYKTKYGVETIASQSLGATDAYAIGKMDAGMVTAAFDRIDKPDIQALLVPGGNFPTMTMIETWEKRYGKPVITTNQATVWGVMRAMAMTTPLSGMGRLLSELPAG